MTLESSGTLYLVGSSGAPTRSIQFELEGVYTGIGLLEAIALSGESYDRITDFYGYSACSDPSPPVPYGVSCYWIMSGVISVSWSASGTYDGVDIQESINNSTWTSFLVESYTGSSPYTSSNSCTFIYYRVRTYNCNGDSSFSPSCYAGSC